MRARGTWLHLVFRRQGFGLDNKVESQARKEGTSKTYRLGGWARGQQPSRLDVRFWCLRSLAAKPALASVGDRLQMKGPSLPHAC